MLVFPREQNVGLESVNPALQLGMQNWPCRKVEVQSPSVPFPGAVMFEQSAETQDPTVVVP